MLLNSLNMQLKNFANMNYKIKLLWVLFFFSLLASLVNITGNLLGVEAFQMGIFDSWALYIPIIFVLLHAIWILSLYRGILFLLLACFVGIIAEYLGINFGVTFGGKYIYLGEHFLLFGVPLNVIFYWAVFIYTGYSITNTFLLWTKNKKPVINGAGIRLPLLILFDSIIVVGIAILMGPLQVRAGSWYWVDGGSYFGIPLMNFPTWMLIVIIVTGIYRTYEFFYPKLTDKKLTSVLLIPVLGYGIMYLNFFSLAIRYNMVGAFYIGSSIMIPVLTTNLFLFYKYSKGRLNILWQ